MTWQWRCLRWLCYKLCDKTIIPKGKASPLPTFVLIMQRDPTWGRFAVYIVWVNITFPCEGEAIWRYLRRKFPQWNYSFSYLLGQWIWYHVQKSIGL